MTRRMRQHYEEAMQYDSIGIEDPEIMEDGERPAQEERVPMEEDVRPNEEENIRLEEERAYDQFTSIFFDDIPEEDAYDD